MRTIIFQPLFLVFMLASISSNAQTNSDDYIYPNPDKRIILIESMKSDQQGISGKNLSTENPIYDLIMKEMAIDFHEQVNRINQCARNLVSNINGPNILLLSSNDGGFPRQGITLEYPDGKKQAFPNLHFADLVLDERRIKQGAFSIYSHEMGHVMMNLILDDFWTRYPNPTSPKQHVSMGVTDYLTAFYEGWGVHFQRLAYDYVERYRRSFHDKYQPNRGVTMSWHSNLDESLRLMDVETKKYIYQKLLPGGIDEDTLSIQERILLEHTSPFFDPTRIKNAQQMLSCEGVLASLFYFISSSRTLQQNYQKISFYRPFLIKEPESEMIPEDLFTPLENVLLKTVWVWSAMNQEVELDPPFIEFIKNWCRIFPEDKKELLTIFINVTKGKTISNELAELTESINYYGQVGNLIEFRKLSSIWMDKYKTLITSATNDIELLLQNVGPELWIEHPDIQIRRTLWMDEPKSPLLINLNTASYQEIIAFTTPEKARKIIALRQQKGYLTERDKELLIFD
ncbi:hypothetical protein ACFLRG_02365 [Bacteroidota bacterium]